MFSSIVKKSLAVISSFLGLGSVMTGCREIPTYYGPAPVEKAGPEEVNEVEVPSPEMTDGGENPELPVVVPGIDNEESVNEVEVPSPKMEDGEDNLVIPAPETQVVALYGVPVAEEPAAETEDKLSPAKQRPQSRERRELFIPAYGPPPAELESK